VSIEIVISKLDTTCKSSDLVSAKCYQINIELPSKSK